MFCIQKTLHISNITQSPTSLLICKIFFANKDLGVPDFTTVRRYLSEKDMSDKMEFILFDFNNF